MSFSRLSNVFATVVSVVSLIAILLANQQEIIEFIDRYSVAFFTSAVVLIYAVSISTIFYFARQRRIRRNKFRMLAPSLLTLNWFVIDQRILRLASSPEFDDTTARQNFERDWRPITEILAELNIPYPQRDASMEELRTYLGMLSPLSVQGDVDDARLILDRIKGINR